MSLHNIVIYVILVQVRKFILLSQGESVMNLRVFVAFLGVLCIGVSSSYADIASTKYVNNKVLFGGTSSTAAATAQKVVTVQDVSSLEPGTFLIVKPTVTSTVANSTIKVNNFPAYPMRYNGAAITTSTDSTVWHGSYGSVFVFDGEYWVFVSRVGDANNTYSAMTAATASEAGTAGLAPAPAAGDNGTQILSSAGTWVKDSRVRDGGVNSTSFADMWIE